MHAWATAPGETTAIPSPGAVSRRVCRVLAVETIDVAAADSARTVLSGLEPLQHGAAQAGFDPSYQLLFVA